MNLADQFARLHVYRDDMDATILRLANESSSLASFTATIQGSNFVEVIKAQAGAIFDGAMDAEALERACAEGFRATLLDFFLHTVGRDAACRLSEGECLHDYVGPEYAERLRRMHFLLETDKSCTKPLPLNPASLMQLVRRGIARGSVGGDGSWGVQGDWEVWIKKALEIACKAIPEALLEKAREGMGRAGFRQIMGRVGAPAALLSHLLAAGSSTSIKEFIGRDPQINQLIRLAQSSIATPRAALFLSPSNSIAPFDLYRQDTYFSATGSSSSIPLLE